MTLRHLRDPDSAAIATADPAAEGTDSDPTSDLEVRSIGPGSGCVGSGEGVPTCHAA